MEAASHRRWGVSGLRSRPLPVLHPDVAKDTESSGFCVGCCQGSDFPLPDFPSSNPSVGTLEEGLTKVGFPGELEVPSKKARRALCLG